MKKILSLAVACCLLTSQALPALAGNSAPSALPDTLAIQAVLDAYTHSVSTGDQRTFDALLLDPAIPFMGLSNGRHTPQHTSGLPSVQQYGAFRKSVFDSGRQLSQRFFDVKIVQEGDLAQVSLQFETRLVGQQSGGRGWKTLTLLRVSGVWKIASEFYTVYPISAN